MIKVSIIIPVYNVDKYLETCLKSVINQTLKEIEIICVNDGSTDNSLDILQKFQINDNRIIIINQENSGQGIARNKALKIAKGEYIGFVDPDDWIKPTMFETLYNTAKEFKSDLVEESYIIHNEIRNYEKYVKNKVKLPVRKSFNHNDVKNYLFSPKLAVWNKLYKAELINKNKIEFMDLYRSEDIIFTVKSRFFANNIVYIDNADYFYRIKKIDISSSDKDVDLDFFIISFKKELIESGMYESLKKEFTEWVINLLLDSYKTRIKEEKYELKQRIKSTLSKESYKKFHNRLLINEFINNIFSVYNTKRDDIKCKIFKIFGIEFIYQVKS